MDAFSSIVPAVEFAQELVLNGRERRSKVPEQNTRKELFELTSDLTSHITGDSSCCIDVNYSPAADNLSSSLEVCHTGVYAGLHTGP